MDPPPEDDDMAAEVVVVEAIDAAWVVDEAALFATTEADPVAAPAGAGRVGVEVEGLRSWPAFGGPL